MKPSSFDGYELIGTPVAVLDSAGRVVFGNRSFLSLLGRESEAALGRAFWSLVATPPERDAIEQAVGALGENTRRTEFLSTCIPCRGAGRTLAWEAIASIGEDGTVSRVVLAGSDVTEHQEAEAALEIARAEAEGILSISSDAIICIDEAQRVTRFNRGAEQAFGYTRDEVIGQRVEMLMPERYRGAHEGQVRAFMQGPIESRRMGERRSVPALRKNGETFPTDAAISKIDVGGRFVMTAAMRDITQRERLESDQRFLIEAGQLLATSLDYEKVLTDLAELAVHTLADCCIVDIVGEDGSIHRLRVAVSQQTDATLAERLRVRPHRRGAQLPFAIKAFQSSIPLRMNIDSRFIESIAEDGAHLAALRGLNPKSFMAVPLIAAEHKLGALVLISASRLYADDDLKLASDLGVRAALAIENARLFAAAQKATRTRDATLGVVAHDLRNPLNAIAVSAQVLGRKMAAADLSGAANSIETILHAAERASRLIADLLEVTRSEAGRLSLDLQPTSPAALVSEAIELLKPLLAGHPFAVAVEENLPTVRADRDRIGRVFSNLLGNAIKFTPPGGGIRVGATRGEGEVIFQVADCGRGILPEHQAHIFDRFWQAERTDSRGTGLGLPIAKGIVEAHGGRIWVKSAAGEGSTFYFSIPEA